MRFASEYEARVAGVRYQPLRLPCYGEEAICERDPDYRPDSSDYPTAADLTADVRLDLARCLQRLGMSAARAAAVASM
jgi:hypothetical protein